MVIRTGFKWLWIITVFIILSGSVYATTLFQAGSESSWVDGMRSYGTTTLQYDTNKIRTESLSGYFTPNLSFSVPFNFKVYIYSGTNTQVVLFATKQTFSNHNDMDGSARVMVYMNGGSNNIWIKDSSGVQQDCGTGWSQSPPFWIYINRNDTAYNITAGTMSCSWLLSDVKNTTGNDFILVGETSPEYFAGVGVWQNFTYNDNFAEAEDTSTLLTIAGGVGNITYTYSPSANTNITAIVNVTGLPVNITVNDTQIASGITSATVQYVFPAGFWNVTGYTVGNDSYNPSSTTIWANITKADNLLTLTNNASWTPTYPTATSISGNGNQTLANLYRNGTLKAIPDNNFFGSGTYAYIWNTSGNSNYSANSTTKNLVIGKATPSYYITFVPNSTTVIYGATVLISCIFAGTPTEVLNVAGFYNDTSVTDASYYFNTSILAGGIYNFTCNSSSTQNYTAYSTNKSLTVNAKIVVPVLVQICFNIGNLQNCFNYNTTDIGEFSTKSHVFCSDNNTLAENITLLDGSNQSQAYHYISCINGCDSTTNECSPTAFMSNIYTIVVIIIIIIGMVLLYKFTR